jgi:uncharacterized protein
MSRDRYGRPLRPPFDPADVVPEIPERSMISGHDAWKEAVAYLDGDLPFHAHEVCEQRWRCCPESERELWRGLAQWGAARTHVARGNLVGAQRVAQRALHTLTSVEQPPSYLDLVMVKQDCERLAKLT